MVDDSELDYVRTFLLKVHTVATTEHFPMERGKVEEVPDATYQKMLVHPPEIVGFNISRTIKRYKVEISETSEANLTTAIKNIQLGCEKANLWVAITGWTRPSDWCYVSIARSEQVKIIPGNGRAKQTIYLDIIWSSD